MKMLRLFFITTFLTGVLYPQFVTLIASITFPEKASGSLIKIKGTVVGSHLLSQKFTQDKYFHSRPSSSDYKTVGSSASQLSPGKIRKTNSAAPDAVTASGSGLDPHISPENAFSQANRVAAVRSLSVEELKRIISLHIEGPTIGIWGQPRVNVLKLNMYLDGQGYHAKSR